MSTIINPLKLFRKKKSINKVEFAIISKVGNMIFDEVEIEIGSERFKFGSSSYILDKDCRLNSETRNPFFVYIEDVPQPLNFADILSNNKKNIKIDGTSLDAILKKKLFYDLFNPTGDTKIKDIIFDILLIVNLILNVLIALKVTGIIDALSD